MPPEKPPVPLAVLAALGLSACEGDKGTLGPCLSVSFIETGDTDGDDTPRDTFGPCLDFPVDTEVLLETADTASDTALYDTADTGVDTDSVVTPCLDFPVETGLGPCLDFPPVDTGPETDSPDTDIGPCLSLPPDTDIGPCLDFPVDTGPDTDIGPCLSPPRETGLTPCLSQPPPTPPPSALPPPRDGGADVRSGRQGALRSVIDKLPADLQKALHTLLDDDRET